MEWVNRAARCKFLQITPKVLLNFNQLLSVETAQETFPSPTLSRIKVPDFSSEKVVRLPKIMMTESTKIRIISDYFCLQPALNSKIGIKSKNLFL